ncbi:MAG: carbon starvation protein A [Candidatus Stygibacter australis]|nr:carbon starvation protein A [Candidatus Stygibacter australis]MDP8323264.1 carbon starvation protein A [Candidatus Stygibacter australis]
MHPLLLIVITIVGYLLAYRLYGRFLGKKIFRLTSSNRVPAQEFEDGVDFMPTRKSVIFGHHYTSIAGTGPIVGPAIAIIWGWLPAVLWIIFGSIFMGAVHDLGALVISLRNRGVSISEVTGKYISPTARILFFIIVFLELWIFIAVLALVIAIIFMLFPASVMPVWSEVILALLLGYAVYKKGGNLTLWSVIVVILMYITIILGVQYPISLTGSEAIPATGIWAIILLIYAFIASILPVNKLLQPRDYINSHELFIVMILIVLGTIFVSFNPDFKMVAPAVNHHVTDAPSFIPFLFITIACGAISGFHSLVSSGTTSRQISSEKDALWVGYGSMLMEGFLAILVIVAVGAGIGLGMQNSDLGMLKGAAAWQSHYASWSAASGLTSKLSAFVVGAANMISGLGIPRSWALAIMGVFVASFAGTSLDSATRIQRYVISEFFKKSPARALQNRYFTTALAVITAGILAFATGADGKGALKLWPLFGAVNQTLAALTLIVITNYLKSVHKKWWLLTAIPALFMCLITFWASVENELSFIKMGNWLLIIVNLIVIVLVVLIFVMGFKRFLKTSIS